MIAACSGAPYPHFSILTHAPNTFTLLIFILLALLSFYPLYLSYIANFRRGRSMRMKIWSQLTLIRSSLMLQTLPGYGTPLPYSSASIFVSFY